MMTTFQVVCADKDNIEDVRSGSEAEDDSESDEPRKERQKDQEKYTQRDKQKTT